MTRSWTLATTALIPLPGCGEPLSNAALREDAAFLAALPTRDQHLAPVDEVESTAARGGELPWLLELAVVYGGAANTYTLSLLGIVDLVRAEPPSQRWDDARRWGPFETEPGLWLQMDMTRSGATYTWDFQTAGSAGGPWETFFTGEHLAGDAVQAGLGSYVYDFGAARWEGSVTGLLVADYDLRDASAVRVELVDLVQAGEVTNSVFWWREEPDGEIRFEYEAETDLNGDAVDELLEVVTRVRPDRAGRGDAIVTGGEFTGVQLLIEECWGPGLSRTWYGDNLGLTAEEGDASTCVYSEPARPENL